MQTEKQRTYKKQTENIGGISMRNLLNKKLKNEKGLTLIELLAVIVILAIIAAIAIPAIGNIISNSKSKAILSDATQVISSAKTAMADGACEVASKCTGTELKDFVEESKENLADADEVTKTATGYTIKYSKFADLNKKYSKELFGTDTNDGSETVDSKDLSAVMGNKD